MVLAEHRLMPIKGLPFSNNLVTLKLMNDCVDDALV